MKHHIRTPKAKKKRSESQAAKDAANRIVMDWSYHDQLVVVGEIVFEQTRVEMCGEQLKLRLGYVPMEALNHDFGEVLNLQ